MDKVGIITRMRERGIKWADVSYILEITEGSAKMALKRASDIKDLGEKPIIKRSKFDTPIVLKLKELARDDVELSIRDLHGELGKLFPDKQVPSKSTIGNILNSSGFKMIKLLKKTLIWPRNQLKRVTFCREMSNYGPAFWDTVIWSDETTVRQRPKSQEKRIRVHSSDSTHGSRINPQVHSGGFGVMFWRCFSKLGLGPLVALEGTMKAKNYVEILRDVVLPELAAAGRPMTFMQDNAPCHTARVVKDFLAENSVETLDWPPQSPDMNPIENLWAIVKRQRQKKYGVPPTKDAIIEQIFEIWDNLDPVIVSNLADSANKRVLLVLEAQGKVTKY